MLAIVSKIISVLNIYHIVIRIWRIFVCTILVVFFVFNQRALALSLSQRIEQFPQWKSKPTVQVAKGDLAYPEWMAGTWQVTSTLTEQVAPLAPDIVTPGFEANQSDLNKPYKFKVRFGKEYFSSGQQSSYANKIPVVAERAFNGKHIAQAYLGKENVLTVKVDPHNPNKQITKLRGDRCLIAKVTGRTTETPQTDRFIATEVTQQLFRSKERIYLNEVETTSAYHLLKPGQIEAEQITAIYLSPQDPDYFTAAGRPVALYRYHLSLNKIRKIHQNHHQ